MSFRYTTFEKRIKRMYRKIFPVPHSSRIMPAYENVCDVNFVSPKALNQFFKRAIKILRQEKGEYIGDYLEFGVFNGNSMGSMYFAAKELGANSIRFFGFDAFEGLPADVEKDDGGVWTSGFYKCSFEQMQDCLRKRTIDPEKINWLKGWYSETLVPATIEKYHIADPGIVFVDCDSYTSSKAVLDFIAPLIKKEVIICLDDWKLNDLDIKGMGEYRSFNEFLEGNPHLIAYKIRSYNRESRSFLVKMR